MERAPLRPVPRRPAGPVDPDRARRHVAAELPALDSPAAAALALAALVGHPREAIAREVGLGPAELSEALARARKALRRELFPLPGSGWCERAERLISDRLDGELAPPGPARLDVHLRNCPRCVEHELRLAQATDALVDGFLAAERPAPEPEPAAEPDPVAEPVVEEPPRPLRVVSPEARPTEPGPRAVDWPAVRPAPEPSPAPPLPAPTAPVDEASLEAVKGEVPVEDPPVEEPVPEELPVEEPPVEEPPVEEPAPEESPVEPPPPAATVVAAAVQRSLSERLAGASWMLLLVLAIVLALGSLGLIVYGSLGGSL